MSHRAESIGVGPPAGVTCASQGRHLGLDLYEEQAREGAQAAWSRGWERRDQIRDGDKILPWINSIAINLFRNQYRRDVRLKPLPDVALPDPAAAGRLKLLVTRLDAKKALDLCDPRTRAMMEERFLDGCLMREVADRHGCSEVAVRVHIYRTTRRLRRLLASSRPHRNRTAGLARPQ
jgi:RNA polymerase sigma factor (sigma-70 family)